MPQVDGVVGVSETTLEEVRRFYQLKAPSVFVPNGVNLRALDARATREVVRKKWTTPLSAKLLLFIGNLGRQKRPDRFLRVVSQVCRGRNDVFAWLLGDGSERKASERLAADLGIVDRVRFLGYQDDVASFVAAGDVYVSCSETDGIPAVVIEAGYLGLPTVAFRVGGMHECVRDGETGVLVSSGDEGALAGAILSLVNSPIQREERGAAARRWVSSRFSMDAVGGQYKAFYRQLVERRKSPSTRIHVLRRWEDEMIATLQTPAAYRSPNEATLETQEENAVERYVLNGLNIWPYLRTATACRLERKSGARREVNQVVEAKDRLRRYRNRCLRTEPRMSGRDGVYGDVVFVTSTNRRENIDGTYWHAVANPLAMEFEKRGVTTLICEAGPAIWPRARPSM